MLVTASPHRLHFSPLASVRDEFSVAESNECLVLMKRKKQRREFVMTRIKISRAEEEARLRTQRLDLSIAEMGLSVRTTNCLEETGILTVRDLLNATPRRLLAISNFGEKTLEEVYQALEVMGFYRPGRSAATTPK